MICLAQLDMYREEEELKNTKFENEFNSYPHTNLHHEMKGLRDSIRHGIGCEVLDMPRTTIRISHHGDTTAFSSEDLLNILPPMIEEPSKVKIENMEDRDEEHTTEDMYHLYAIRVAIDNEQDVVIFRYDYFYHNFGAIGLETATDPALYNKPTFSLYIKGHIDYTLGRVSIEAFNNTDVIIVKETIYDKEICREFMVRGTAFDKDVLDNIFKIEPLYYFFSKEDSVSGYSGLNYIHKVGLDYKYNSLTPVNHGLEILDRIMNPILSNHPGVIPNYFGNYKTLLKGEEITKKITLLVKDKGYKEGNIKGILKIKHIPSERYETLVSVGTITTWDLKSGTMHIPIFVSMDSIVNDKHVYLAFKPITFYNNDFTIDLVSVPIKKLIKMLTDVHAILPKFISSDTSVSKVLMLKAKDDTFVEFFGGITRKYTLIERYNKFIALCHNNYTIYSTEQSFKLKNFERLIEEYLQGCHVFQMKRKHLDTLIERLEHYTNPSDLVVV